MKNKKASRIARYIIIVLLCLILVPFTAIAIADAVIFRRCDYGSYDTRRYLTHDDIDHEQYPYETLEIPSGDHNLTGFLYGAGNTNGLIVLSPGHTETTDIKLYETLSFVDAGWTVLSYDYTGCYNSEGASADGYTQSVHDLDAVLTCVENQSRFTDLPLVLFGHSLGAYASAAVLAYGPDVDAAIIASGFDTPKEQWTYTIERFTGPFHTLLTPFTQSFIALKYGDEKNLSAIDGINSVTIPVLVISGTQDEFYGAESPIYAKRSTIINPACEFLYETRENHDGHYDYFLTDAALAYQEEVNAAGFAGEIDKNLYLEHDKEFMEELNQFLLEAVG